MSWFDTALEVHPGLDQAIGVIGVGYVGLPVALAFARQGFQVVAYDVNADHIAAIRRGDPEVVTASPDELRQALASGNLQPTLEPTRLAPCAAIIICVPTPLADGGTPDLSALQSAAQTVAQNARQGVTVVLESTSYPGTTRDILLPLMEKRLGRVGIDFFLGFVPERIDPGNAAYNLANTPRIVGGMTTECTHRISRLYQQIVPQCHPVSSPEAAELAKLLENSFRNINIAWANELMRFCDENHIDIDEVIRAAATKPFGFMPFWPGPGVGGECIPVDPRYLAWRARVARSPLYLLERALDTNDLQPLYATRKITEILHRAGRPLSQSRVLIVGVSYKPNVADIRNAPALIIIERLLNLGAHVLYHDPLVDALEIDGRKLRSVTLTERLLPGIDLAVVVTKHSAVDVDYVCRTAPRFLDLTHGTLRSPV